MNTRLALAVLIASTSSGCATPAEEQQPAAAAQAQAQERCYASGQPLAGGWLRRFVDGRRTVARRLRARPGVGSDASAV